MSVKIRLKRIGRKKQPTYRIVVVDSRCARGGREIEVLGSYTPYKKDKPLSFDTVKYSDWRSKGAIPSEAVVKLSRRAKSGKTTVKAAVSETKPAVQPVPEPTEPAVVSESVESPAGE